MVVFVPILSLCPLPHDRQKKVCVLRRGSPAAGARYMKRVSEEGDFSDLSYEAPFLGTAVQQVHVLHVQNIALAPVLHLAGSDRGYIADRGERDVSAAAT